VIDLGQQARSSSSLSQFYFPWASPIDALLTEEQSSPSIQWATTCFTEVHLVRVVSLVLQERIRMSKQELKAPSAAAAAREKNEEDIKNGIETTC
jgi:hypothetical protein